MSLNDILTAFKFGREWLNPDNYSEDARIGNVISIGQPIHKYINRTIVEEKSITKLMAFCAGMCTRPVEIYSALKELTQMYTAKELTEMYKRDFNYYFKKQFKND